MCIEIAILMSNSSFSCFMGEAFRSSTLNCVAIFLVLFVQAYRRGLKYPRFTFLHAAWWSDQWWRGKVTEGHNCTIEERETVVEYSLAVLLYEFIENDDDVAETGLVSYVYAKKNAVAMISLITLGWAHFQNEVC